MADKRTCQLLLKKLSALRATLSDDEQELLDEWLLKDGVSGSEVDTRIIYDEEPISSRKSYRRSKAKRYSFKFDQQQEAYILQ